METENVEKYLEKMEYLNFRRALIAPEVSKEEIKQFLRCFLKQFGVTILMIVEEYFHNPFSKDDEESCNMKRSLNFKDISND